MIKIKIFLASSEELKDERLEIADLISHMNLALEHENIRIYLVKWEYLDATMSPIHKQEEYNKTLEQCDLCLVLFATRFGKYTESELKTAYDKLCKREGTTQKLFVFFRDDNRDTDELIEFKKTFNTDYPFVPEIHFYSISSLKKEVLEIWHKFQKMELDNKYPVTYQANDAYLNGERINRLENTNLIYNE